MVIKKVGNKYCVFSENGTENLGCSDTKEGAVKRLQQVEHFKNKGSSMNYDQAFTNMGKALQTGSDNSLVEQLRQGSIAGRPSPRLLDTREHFPVTTETQAHSSLTRAMQLVESPNWYGGTLDELRTEVFIGATTAHPDADFKVRIPADQVIALSDGEESAETTKQVEDPADVRKNDVQHGVKRPTLTSASHLAKVLSEQSGDESHRQTMAGNLLEHLEQQEKAIKVAKQVASRLLKKGLTADEFQGLISFLQEDVLRELLHKGATAQTDRRIALLAKLTKKDD